MILIDYITIGLLALFCVLGYAMGFGKQLRLLTKGIKGVIISIFVCYILFGAVVNLNIVQDLLSMFREMLINKNNAFCNFLLNIRIEIICAAVSLFLVVQILRKIIVAIISKTMESENTAIKILNKLFGVILSIALLLGLSLIALQITALAVGTGDNSVTEFLRGSFFGLDSIYLNNPLTLIFNL